MTTSNALQCGYDNVQQMNVDSTKAGMSADKMIRAWSDQLYRFQHLVAVSLLFILKHTVTVSSYNFYTQLALLFL